MSEMPPTLISDDEGGSATLTRDSATAVANLETTEGGLTTAAGKCATALEDLETPEAPASDTLKRRDESPLATILLEPTDPRH